MSKPERILKIFQTMFRSPVGSTSRHEIIYLKYVPYWFFNNTTNYINCAQTSPGSTDFLYHSILRAYSFENILLNLKKNI